MKKIISLLAVVALVACLATAAFAAESCTITIDSATASAGETVTLNVVIDVNPGVTAVSLTFGADEGLKLTEISTAGCVLDGATVNPATGKVSYSASSLNTGVGTLLTLTYEVADDAACGEYSVYVKTEDENGKPINNKLVNNLGGNSVKHEVTFVAGVVTVSADTGCDHDLVHVDAVEPGCHYTGNVEYWYCTICETVWTDEALTQISNHLSVILPAIGGEVEHFEAVEPGCHYDGNIEYWVCYQCEQVWQDEALTQLTNIKNVVLPAIGGEVEHFEAVEPGCHYDGNIEYWVCYECEQVWQDAALTQLTNIKNVVLPAIGGDVIHVDAVAPGCHYEGNIEYWYCPECEQFWQDAALTQLTNSKNVILPATGEGNVVHMEAVAPGCHYEGNIEYWICYDCEQVWQDEALTQLTNIKNVVLPAIGGEVVHFEAVAPGCHYTGNIEYWICYECEQVWQDEALTQLTNIKNVVLPALGGEVIHVDAVAPTCTENGNIEYWYCEECEQVWQDEALTQLTNFKNVILPATGHIDENKDGICDVCGADLTGGNADTGDTISVAVAAVVISAMGVVALPLVKKHF